MDKIGAIFSKAEYLIGAFNAAFQGFRKYAESRKNPFGSGNRSSGWSNRVKADEVPETDNPRGHTKESRRTGE